MQFLVLPINGFPIVVGDFAVEAIASSQFDSDDLCGMGVLYCEETDSALVEETVMKAASGVQTSCSVILTGEKCLMQMDCQPVSHDWHGYCVRCTLDHVSVTDLTAIQDEIIIVSPKSPHPIIVAGSHLMDAFGYGSKEVINRSLACLQGPSSSPESFITIMDAARRCVRHETTISVNRKDGSELQLAVSIHPTVLQSESGKSQVMVCFHATPISTYLMSSFHPIAEPDLAYLLTTLQLAPSPPSTAECCLPPSADLCTPSQRHRFRSARVPAAFAELAVLRPLQQADHLSLALTSLRQSGLVLHWEWSQPPGPEPAAPEARARVLADVPALHARAAAAAAGCPTGFLCAWILASAEFAAAELAAASAGKAGMAGAGWARQECGGCEQATDLDFLLCSGV
jgi:hypothetical protein